MAIKMLNEKFNYEIGLLLNIIQFSLNENRMLENNDLTED